MLSVRKTLAELPVGLGHSEARTTAVYTRGAERWRPAKSAMDRINVSHCLVMAQDTMGATHWT